MTIATSRGATDAILPLATISAGFITWLTSAQTAAAFAAMRESGIVAFVSMPAIYIVYQARHYAPHSVQVPSYPFSAWNTYRSVPFDSWTCHITTIGVVLSGNS